MKASAKTIEDRVADAMEDLFGDPNYVQPESKPVPLEESGGWHELQAGAAFRLLYEDLERVRRETLRLFLWPDASAELLTRAEQDYRLAVKMVGVEARAMLAALEPNLDRVLSWH